MLVSTVPRKEPGRVPFFVILGNVGWRGGGVLGLCLWAQAWLVLRTGGEGERGPAWGRHVWVQGTFTEYLPCTRQP